ncbi:hypothetical protein [Acidovorax sp. BL-A-41-H1]|uniref:hypothetical protein n=1 Tax=Acidovorax sp. BL-A-41-H1 TaxID=3421102 RepID=UPI003F79C7B6
MDGHAQERDAEKTSAIADKLSSVPAINCDAIQRFVTVGFYIKSAWSAIKESTSSYQKMSAPDGFREANRRPLDILGRGTAPPYPGARRWKTVPDEALTQHPGA